MNISHFDNGIFSSIALVLISGHLVSVKIPKLVFHDLFKSLTIFNKLPKYS
jgi:hypothetical protein